MSGFVSPETYFPPTINETYNKFENYFYFTADGMMNWHPLNCLKFPFFTLIKPITDFVQCWFNEIIRCFFPPQTHTHTCEIEKIDKRCQWQFIGTILEYQYRQCAILNGLFMVFSRKHIDKSQLDIRKSTIDLVPLATQFITDIFFFNVIFYINLYRYKMCIWCYFSISNRQYQFFFFSEVSIVILLSEMNNMNFIWQMK